MPQPLDRAVKHPMKICKKLEQQREPEHFLGMYLYQWKPLFKGVETDELELLTRRLKECCAGLRNIRTGVDDQFHCQMETNMLALELRCLYRSASRLQI
uniref:Uncharacterized protein n=1 Tax=Oryza rufipogon TaxID=4529 RepID=A0A0E0NDU9_ORYRU